MKKQTIISTCIIALLTILIFCLLYWFLHPTEIPNSTISQAQLSSSTIQPANRIKLADVANSAYYNRKPITSPSTTSDSTNITSTTFPLYTYASGNVDGIPGDIVAALSITSYSPEGNNIANESIDIFGNKNGMPTYLGSYAFDAADIVNAISIQNGLIYADTLMHGPKDPSYYPTLHTTQTFKWDNGIVLFKTKPYFPLPGITSYFDLNNRLAFEYSPSTFIVNGSNGFFFPTSFNVGTEVEYADANGTLQSTDYGSVSLTRAIQWPEWDKQCPSNEGDCQNPVENPRIDFKISASSTDEIKAALISGEDPPVNVPEKVDDLVPVSITGLKGFVRAPKGYGRHGQSQAEYWFPLQHGGTLLISFTYLSNSLSSKYFEKNGFRTYDNQEQDLINIFNSINLGVIQIKQNLKH
jgi:hypothetical protein